MKLIILLLFIAFFVVTAICMFFRSFFQIVDPDDQLDKTMRASRAHKKERNHRSRRAATNALNMVADGCLEPPRRKQSFKGV